MIIKLEEDVYFKVRKIDPKPKKSMSGKNSAGTRKYYNLLKYLNDVSIGSNE